MLNKLKSLFKNNPGNSGNTIAKTNDSKDRIPITPETATKLQVYYDDGIGQVLKVYYISNETIYLISTGGIFTINATLKEPPILVDKVDNAPIAELDFHPECGFALAYGEGVCLWKNTQKSLIEEIEGYSARAVSWSDDGNKLLSGWAEVDSDWYGKGLTRIINLQGAIQWEKRLDNGWITACAFGKSYYAFGSATGSIWVYTNDYKEIARIELEGLNPLPEILSFIEDILYIISVDDDFEMRVLIWTPENTELIEQEMITGHDQTCISTDGRIAFITGDETRKRKPNHLYIRCLKSNTEKSATIDGDIKAIDFSPDCKSLALIDESGIKTLSSANGRIKAFSSLGDFVGCNNITVSEYSDYIATWGSSSHEVIFLSKEDGTVVKRMQAIGGRGATFLPNGIFATATSKGLFYLDPENETTRPTCVTEDISYLLLLHDKQTLLISSNTTKANYEHQLILYNTMTGETKNIPTTEGFIHKVIELVKNNLLLTFSARGNADFYNIQQDKCIKRLTSYVNVSPDEKYFAWTEKIKGEKEKDILISKGINGEINRVRLQPRNNRLIQSIKMAFSRDEKQLLASCDTTVIIDIEALNITKEIELQGDIKWSPTGDIFVIGGAYETDANLPFKSNKFIVFDKEGIHIAEYQVPRIVRDLQFSHDGSKIIVLCEYGGVFIFKVIVKQGLHNTK